jgi:two-component system nitrate/nitrite response regulator NarL
MEGKAKIRVLLVDDHPFVLQGIRASLLARKQFEIVGEAVNGKEAIEKAKELAPDVIVMDLTMPVMNGVDATRALRKCLPEVKVLMLTMHQRLEVTAQIADSGARGYVSKSTPSSELVRAIETVHNGETYFKSGAAAATTKALAQTADNSSPATGTELSLREREVLALIAEGMSNKEAAAWLDVSVRTVEKHRERIMNKLNLHSIVELTKYAIANGIVQIN